MCLSLGCSVVVTFLGGTCVSVSVLDFGVYSVAVTALGGVCVLVFGMSVAVTA